jgi:hypothetical protein
LKVLTDPASFCGKPRMPKDGPFITDDGYTVTIDGVAVAGDKIARDLQEWLMNGFPE